jgi:transcriptional regulator with PAS, ATPase and Fis domain
MPPLRQRKEDVFIITDNFIEHFNQDLHRKITHIPEEVREAFLNYNWPGNVRELRSTIERAVLLSEGEVLNARYIQLEEEVGDKVVKVEKSDGKMVLQIPLEELSLTKVEESVIKEALDLNEWNQTRTAEMLGITREVLRYRMKKMGLLE